ncbi:MAG TPA: hypothetical protein VKZ51_00710 [Cyclobacteriaceae bacterium]|nr:hypothetical protein [Cyclobacteriaceae bacterium]
MNAKKFLFRVDAGGKTGLGHFYRSLHLAQELKKRGHIIEFIHRPTDFWSQQQRTGFPHVSFRSDNEHEETLAYLRKGKFDTFFVDGVLDFEEERFHEIKKLVNVVFYQNLSSSRFLADVFILPSIHQTSDFFSVFNAGTKIFQGLEYFTFNQSIASLKVKNPNNLTEVRQVGIISGGSDPENALLRLYQRIDHARFFPIQFTYFCGINYMHPSTIPVDYPQNVRFKSYDAKDIIHCSLLLSAFGVSTYEFMYLGMPILSFGHQPSNSFASRVLAEKTGGIYHLGDISEINSRTLNGQLSMFIGQRGKRLNLMENSKALLDLNGVRRVANILENE